MSSTTVISTDKAPAAIGTYSQAVATGALVFISGQIPLDPKTMTLVGDDITAQTRQVFDNLAAVAEAAGGSLNDLVKLTVYLLDLGNFQIVNEVMAESGGKNVMTAHWSGGISKNPYMSFVFTGGAKGDEVKISWVDNQGGSDSAGAGHDVDHPLRKAGLLQ